MTPLQHEAEQCVCSLLLHMCSALMAGASRIIAVQSDTRTPTYTKTLPFLCTGPHHTLSLPPDLMGIPGGPAPQGRAGQGSQQRPSRSHPPLAATMSVPTGSRLQSVNQNSYLDPVRLTVGNLDAQEQQQSAALGHSDRLTGSRALRRLSHVTSPIQ